MLKYEPAKLQKDIMDCASYELLDLLKVNCVNPATITEIAVIDCLSILRISSKLYATSSLGAGYDGGGPSVLEELLKWCGCADPGIFDAIHNTSKIHFRRENDRWTLL